MTGLGKLRFANLGIGGKYLVGVTGVVMIVIALLFFRQFQKEKTFIMGQLQSQARLLGRQIMLTRRWLSDQGGVFVRASDSRTPYLADNEVVLADGHYLQFCNPALVTREISNYALKQGLYRFRLTSTRLINPDNAPDETERQALASFAAGKNGEFNLLQELNSEKVFRHIRPLYIEDSCLLCHRKYGGYKIGDLRGCLSVIIPSDAAEGRISELSSSLFRDAFTIVFLTITILYILNYNLVVRPLKQLRRQVRNFKRNISYKFNPLTKADEIGELSCSFAEMANTLLHQHQEMERRVELATQELLQFNKQLNEANLSLLQRDAMKSDFLATVSHELRTPLTNIQGGVDYLLQTVGNEDQRSYLRLIERNIRGLITMVGRLLDLARIELDKIELECEELDLTNLLREVALLFRAEAGKSGIEIDCQAESIQIVLADYRRLNQVFINLLDNAVRFSPPNQMVIICLKVEADWVNVEVIDHGPGIAAEDIEEIFVRYRCRNGESIRRGSGLGLAIAKGLIEAHGGSLTVVSRTGIETVFTVRLQRLLPVMNESNGAEKGKTDVESDNHHSCR